MRKLMLPLAAVCAFGVGAAPAMAESANVKQNKKLGKINGAVKGVQKAISILEDINAGQTASVNDAHAKVDAVKKTVDTIVSVAGTALPALENGLKQAAAGLKALQGGLTTVSQGSLAAAGTANPNSSGATTAASDAVPAVALSTLSAGTTYRQFVLLSDSATFPGAFAASQAALVAALTAGGLGTLPMGVRTWVKMPDVNSAALGGDFYKNTWVCMNGKTTTAARALLVSSLSASVGGAANAGAIADVVGTCP